MPISYDPGAVWPPAEVAEAMPFYTEWLTWWRGQTTELHKLYLSRSANANFRPPSQRRGVVMVWNDFWYGRQSLTGISRLHVPAAKDVASLSAGQLFADPPSLVLPERVKGKQDRLDAIMEDAGIYTMLHEAAEKDAAAGGVYLRASANAEVADMPIGEAILPDCAIPEFYGPWLIAVTFWRVLGRERGPRVRHLERHEMVGTGKSRRCVIEHAVYEGTEDRIGRRVSLRDYPETERFAELVDSEGRIMVGTSVLDVVYVPNIKPHLFLEGSPLGRSDFAGAEGEMDALDETMASWMRDIRLGKGRLVVPRTYVRRGDAGAGGSFDAEAEIFTQVNAQVGNQDSAQLAMTIAQFSIRVDEHERTTRELWRVILKNAGFDGTENNSEAAAETATKTNDKASRKRSTRAIKMRYWTPALKRFAQVLLELDQLYFGGPGPDEIDVEWPDASAPDAETLARTVQLLDAAGAVSQRTKVAMVHPEWSSEQVDEEVILIQGDAPAPPDPADPNAVPEPPAAEPVDPQPVDEPVDEGAAGDGGLEA